MVESRRRDGSKLSSEILDEDGCRDEGSATGLMSAVADKRHRTCNRLLAVIRGPRHESQ
jgi:hypothetical protein